MAYVDGYVLPVPAKRLGEYRKIAAKAGKIWREHGALDYWECAGDDLEVKWGKPFPKVIKTKPGETVIFAWVVYKNRKHRDAVNKKVMADERLTKMMDPKDPIFDAKRMCYGGFKNIVHA
jgi:uncharacterized protein YbaA (DUF1428 family)